LLKRFGLDVRACRGTLKVVADRYEEMLEKGDEQDEARKQRLRRSPLSSADPNATERCRG